EIRHDRKPEAASERALIEAYAAIDRALRLFLRQSRSVVIDDDEKMSFVRAIAHADTAGRPFAGVLYEIAENLLEILAVGRIGRVGAHVVDDLELAIRVDACEPACDLGNDRSDRYRSATTRPGGRGACEMSGHDALHRFELQSALARRI